MTKEDYNANISQINYMIDNLKEIKALFLTRRDRIVVLNKPRVLLDIKEIRNKLQEIESTLRVFPLTQGDDK